MKNNEKLLLFDGVCNLCNSLVLFIIKRDPKSQFKFAALQSACAQTFLKKFGLESANLNSIIYIKDGKYFLKSSAILYTLRDLGGVWKFFFILIVIPKFIRDFLYNLIAKYRYKIFGKKESCIIPNPKISQRFYF